MKRAMAALIVVGLVLAAVPAMQAAPEERATEHREQFRCPMHPEMKPS